jgi:hypothetical protein
VVSTGAVCLGVGLVALAYAQTLKPTAATMELRRIKAAEAYHRAGGGGSPSNQVARIMPSPGETPSATLPSVRNRA